MQATANATRTGEFRFHPKFGDAKKFRRATLSCAAAVIHPVQLEAQQATGATLQKAYADLNIKLNLPPTRRKEISNARLIDEAGNGVAAGGAVMCCPLRLPMLLQQMRLRWCKLSVRLSSTFNASLTVLLFSSPIISLPSSARCETPSVFMLLSQKETAYDT